jgi:hypothetical protein
MKVLVLFSSTYGRVYRLARAVATGAGAVPGVAVVVKRVRQVADHAAHQQPRRRWLRAPVRGAHLAIRGVALTGVYVRTRSSLSMSVDNSGGSHIL